MDDHCRTCVEYDSIMSAVCLGCYAYNKYKPNHETTMQNENKQLKKRIAELEGDLAHKDRVIEALAPQRVRDRLNELQLDVKVLSFLPKMAEDAEEVGFDVIQLEMEQIWSILNMRQFIAGLGEQWAEANAIEVE